MVEVAPTTPKKAVKAATSSVESVAAAFPKVDLAKIEVPAAVREIAEKSVQNAREAYEKLKTSAEETTDLLEDTYATASKGVAEYNTVALESLRANVNATFDYFAAILGAKSVAEAVELSTSHLRKQFDVLSSQAKELSVLAQKVATETVEPIKASVEKNIKKAS